MGTKAAISEEEYLHTSFPGVDCEYRDGELVERALPEYIHGRAQLELYFFSNFCENSFRFSPLLKHAQSFARVFT